MIGDAHKELTAVYDLVEPDAVKRQLKASVFATLTSSYEQLSIDEWNGNHYFDPWFDPPLNNAKLALYTTYESSLCAFQGLLDKAENNLPEFHRLAGHKARLQTAEREEWLQQSCSTIAPQDNL